MNEHRENEIIRLVKDIAGDEEQIRSAEIWGLSDKAERYVASVQRKLEVLKALTKDKA